MEANLVKNKILLNVAGTGAKKLIMSTIVNLGYDFNEFQDYDDLKFKQSLFKNKIMLIIYELNYTTYKKDFEMIKNITENKIKTLLIIERYDSKIIDDALAAGANDIIVLPLKEDVLKSKLKTVLSTITKPLEFVEIKEVKEIAYIDSSVIEYEILRAYRGKYSISLVMVEFNGLNEEEVNDMSEEIKIKLRETDLVMKYSNNKLLLICPFTVKENIVEVENKVRQVVKDNVNKVNLKTNIIVYGITYPKDGENASELIKSLEEGIASSRIIGRIRGTFHDIKRDEIEVYKKIFKKK